MESSLETALYMYEYTVDRIIFFVITFVTSMNEREEQKTKRKFNGKVRPTHLSGLVKAVRYY